MSHGKKKEKEKAEWQIRRILLSTSPSNEPTIRWGLSTWYLPKPRQLFFVFVFVFSDLMEVGMLREKKVKKEILCWETYLFLCVYEQTVENW